MSDHRSAAALVYRHLYRCKRWRDTRARQFAAEPFCRMCLAKEVRTYATVCDHVDPKTKRPATFYDGPFQSLCQTHHNSTKQGDESRGYSGAADASGWPTDPRHPANQRF